MAEAKIEIKVGGVSFSGEGGEKWLAEQLEKLLKNLPQMTKFAPPPDENAEGQGGSGLRFPRTTGTLASFLKVKSASTNQVRKFLATSIWLHDHDNRQQMSTSDVTKALADNHQSRLSNATQCLNQNVSKGFCEKSGKQFFVTDEGRAEIGQ